MTRKDNDKIFLVVLIIVLLSMCSCKKYTIDESSIVNDSISKSLSKLEQLSLSDSGLIDFSVVPDLTVRQNLITGRVTVKDKSRTEINVNSNNRNRDRQVIRGDVGANIVNKDNVGSEIVQDIDTTVEEIKDSSKKPKKNFFTTVSDILQSIKFILVIVVLVVGFTYVRRLFR
jgi:hypothetical protein